MNPTISPSSSIVHSSTVSSSPGHSAVCSPHQRITSGSSRMAFSGARSAGAVGRRVTRSPWIGSIRDALRMVGATGLRPTFARRQRRAQSAARSARRRVPDDSRHHACRRAPVLVASACSSSPRRAVRAGAALAAGRGERGPRLAPPVRGEVVRAFAYAGDPFARGHHRGIDLAAAPGAPVRAACSGRVTFAGSAGANGRAVTVRCGAWSVTHLPLRGLAVRAGESRGDGRARSAPSPRRPATPACTSASAAPATASATSTRRRCSRRHPGPRPVPPPRPRRPTAHHRHPTQRRCRSPRRRDPAPRAPTRPGSSPAAHRPSTQGSPRGPPGPGSRCCCSARSAPARRA